MLAQAYPGIKTSLWMTDLGDVIPEERWASMLLVLVDLRAVEWDMEVRGRSESGVMPDL